MLQIMIRCLTIYHAKLCLLYPLNNSHYLQISYRTQNYFKDFLFNDNSKTAALFPDTAVRVYQYPTFCFLLSFNFFLLYRPNITEGNGRCTNTMFSSPFSVSQLLSFLFSFISRRLILMQQRRTEVLLIINPFLSPPSLIIIL